MIDIDLTSLIEPALKGGAAAVDPAMVKSISIPSGSGSDKSWFGVIMLCVTLIAIGVGIYTLTCEDGKKAKLTYDGKTAILHRDEPLPNDEDEE